MAMRNQTLGAAKTLQSWMLSVKPEKSVEEECRADGRRVDIEDVGMSYLQIGENRLTCWGVLRVFLPVQLD